MKGPIKQRQDWKNRVRKWRVVGKIYGIKKTVERATKTETDTRTEYKGVGKLGLFQKHKPKHPHHVKVSTRGRK